MANVCIRLGNMRLGSRRRNRSDDIMLIEYFRRCFHPEFLLTLQIDSEREKYHSKATRDYAIETYVKQGLKSFLFVIHVLTVVLTI